MMLNTDVERELISIYSLAKELQDGNSGLCVCGEGIISMKLQPNRGREFSLA